MATRKKMDTKRSIIIIIACIILIGSGILLMQSFNREATTREDNEEIRLIYYGDATAAGDETATAVSSEDATAALKEDAFEGATAVTPEDGFENATAALPDDGSEGATAAAPEDGFENAAAAQDETPASEGVLSVENTNGIPAEEAAAAAVSEESDTKTADGAALSLSAKNAEESPSGETNGAEADITPEPAETEAVPEETEAPAETGSEDEPSAEPTAEPADIPEPIIMRLATLPPVMDEFTTLKGMYPDIIGWLYSGSLIDLPVMQRDNDYYLSHNYKGEESNAGALFLDETNQVWPGDANTVIYGHNMKDKTMFGDLDHYLSQSYADGNPIITFKTLYDVQRYAVIAAFNASTEENSSNYFNPREFMFTKQSFSRYVADVKNRSRIESPVEAEYGDNLLTLVTCSTDPKVNRFILVLRKLRPDETVDGVKALFR